MTPRNRRIIHRAVLECAGEMTPSDEMTAEPSSITMLLREFRDYCERERAISRREENEACARVVDDWAATGDEPWRLAVVIRARVK